MPAPCPICGKPVKPDDPEQPFCSERCRLIDLANWASEKYAVPGEPLRGPGEDDADDGQ